MSIHEYTHTYLYIHICDMKAQRLFEGRKEPAYVRTKEKEGGGEVGTNKIQCFCKKNHI